MSHEYDAPHLCEDCDGMGSFGTPNRGYDDDGGTYGDTECHHCEGTGEVWSATPVHELTAEQLHRMPYAAREDALDELQVDIDEARPGVWTFVAARLAFCGSCRGAGCDAHLCVDGYVRIPEGCELDGGYVVLPDGARVRHVNEGVRAWRLMRERSAKLGIAKTEPVPSRTAVAS